jgi:hypothetical protein
LAPTISNWTQNPWEVINKRFKKSKSVALESNMIVVIKEWKDIREVLTLSKRHFDSSTTIQQIGGEIKIPIMVVDYSNSKALTDLSDKIKASSLAIQ